MVHARRKFVEVTELMTNMTYLLSNVRNKQITLKLPHECHSAATALVQIEADWIEMWIADIVRSAKKLRSRAVLDELDALCDLLENAERHATRLRGS